ncbi:hypothetical protein J7K27_05895 [Candidatus Bathyarchaeota archaeon]|nr:hypothetical protein [Candidatus Bathyarchaeota archaeon]
MVSSWFPGKIIRNIFFEATKWRNIAVRLPEEVKAKMSMYKGINWSEICRKAISFVIDAIETNNLYKRIKLSDLVTDPIDEKIYYETTLFTFRVPEELYKKIKKYKGINVSNICRSAIILLIEALETNNLQREISAIELIKGV